MPEKQARSEAEERTRRRSEHGRPQQEPCSPGGHPRAPTAALPARSHPLPINHPLASLSALASTRNPSPTSFLPIYALFYHHFSVVLPSVPSSPDSFTSPSRPSADRPFLSFTSPPPPPHPPCRPQLPPPKSASGPLRPSTSSQDAPCRFTGIKRSLASTQRLPVG